MKQNSYIYLYIVLRFMTKIILTSQCHFLGYEKALYNKIYAVCNIGFT